MNLPEEGRKKIFVSYSHHDSEWLKRLQVHLRPLEREGLVELWDDTKIQSGAQWRKEISKALDSACVAILLISADFIASDFIADEELPRLLAAAEEDGVKILSVILSPSRYEKIDSLARFQSVNPPSKPLISMDKWEQEALLDKLSEDVVQAIDGTPKKSERAERAEDRQVSNLPFPRNRFFTGRDDLLNGLQMGFRSGQWVQTLNGLGGIGKTQTAIEYAYRYSGDYKAVLWCKAHSKKSLTSDFVAMAKVLELQEKNAENQDEAIKAVKRWLERNAKWLLVLDNVDDPGMVSRIIPVKSNGHVLLTTQLAEAIDRSAAPLSIEKMSTEEGALFL